MKYYSDFIYMAFNIYIFLIRLHNKFLMAKMSFRAPQELESGGKEAVYSVILNQ